MYVVEIVKMFHSGFGYLTEKSYCADNQLKINTMKRITKAIILLMLSMTMLFIANCKPENDPNNGGGNDNVTVKVATFEPQAIMQTSAVCGGEVTQWKNVELEELGVCWSMKSNPTVMDSHQSTSIWQEPFYCTLTDLELDTKYYVRAYARKGEDCYYGNEESFTTLPILSGPSAPIVITMFVTDIGSDYAVVYGSVAGDGGKTVTERGICWSSSHTTPTIGDSHLVNGSGLGDFSVTMTGLTPNTTYYARFYAINEIGIGYGRVVGFTTEKENKFYVDLGLPSGTLWATCNVGATTPEGYGDYFAWGETEPKTYYSWSTYKYCNGDYDQLIKYCNHPDYGYNGFTDNLTTLLPEDDAATVNLGNDWRMPTIEELWELESCMHQITERNGVKGCLFTANNGSSLFLPFAGCRDSGTLNDTSIYGIYWSSSVRAGHYRPHRAYFYVSPEDQTPDPKGYRYLGYSVRAVRNMR